MDQALAVDNGFREPDVQLIVVMEMSEGLAAVAKRGKSIISTRQWTMLNAQFPEALNQLTA
jgi:hypothetical protein